MLALVFFLWAVLIIACLLGHEHLAVGTKGRKLCADILQWNTRVEWLVVLFAAGLLLECFSR